MLEPVSCVTDSLTVSLAEPQCGGDAGGHVLDGGFGGSLAELAFRELVVVGAGMKTDTHYLLPVRSTGYASWCGSSMLPGSLGLFSSSTL